MNNPSNPSPIWLVVIGCVLLVVGIVTWRYPLWGYDIGLWLADLVENRGPEGKARWKAAHPETESIARLTVGCPAFFFAFLFLTCGLITLLSSRG